MKDFLRKYHTEILFTVVILIAAALLYGLTHTKGTAAVALLQYGDPQTEKVIALDQDAVYDIDTGSYTIHLQVKDGGIAFIDSPCPDHLCEGFGILKNIGDWAACMPAKASVTIVEK